MKVIVSGQKKSSLASLGVEALAPLVFIAISPEMPGAPEIDVCCFGLI
jgi:hypothetical protein